MILGNDSIITVDGAAFIRVAALGHLTQKIEDKHGKEIARSVDNMIDEVVDGFKEELYKEAKK